VRLKNKGKKMNKNALSNFFSVVELRTKLVSVSTLCLATAFVSWRSGFPDLLPYLLMWTATLAVDMGTTAFNNYYDYWRGTDRHRDIDEPDKVLIHAGVEPGFAFWSAFWCFTAAVVFGLAIAFTGHLWVIPVGAACMAVGFLYTGGPFPISRTPFGELFAGGCLGFVLFAIACGVWGMPPDATVILAGLPSAFVIASILTVNNTCDIEGDTAAGRRTLSILLGAKGGEIVVILLALSALAVGVYGGFAGYLPRAVAWTMLAGSVPYGLRLREMHRAGFSHATKGPNMGRILSCLLIFSAFMAAGYVIDMFFFGGVR
jgi:1,4-dihydroxy-2-naphthoate octaprenyltransferase